jgi:hypothetical protein
VPNRICCIEPHMAYQLTVGKHSFGSKEDAHIEHHAILLTVLALR